MDNKFTSLEQMLALLPYDLLHKILKFQEPKEIIALYESTTDVIQEMIKYTNFIVECKVVLSNEELNWFQTKNINVQLLEEYKIDEYETQFWFKNGKRHRDNDLPAEIYQNGNQCWYKNGKIHRDNDLPAEIETNGTQRWYKNHNLHRDNDLPAIILADGTQKWYKNDVKYTPI
jgi:hypothetical protein